jgi:hypothetical protein
LHNLYSSPNSTKWSKQEWDGWVTACMAHINFVGNPKEMRLLRRCRCR